MATENALEKKMAQLGMNATPEEFIDGLPAPVKRRVEELHKLQEQHEELEAKFRKERAELEEKYQKLYAPLYTERQEIVSGSKAVPAKEGEAAGTDEDKGIPEFWLSVLLKNDVAADLVKDKDVDVLTYLTDITTEALKNEEGVPTGFKLCFTFAQNPYFTNTVLEKSYFLAADDDGVLEKAEGTKIQWNQGKDVTIKVMKKKPKKGGKPDAKPQIKTEKVDSFFNFFSPPELPGEDDEIDEEAMEELQMQVENDYEVGATIREKLIPDAVRWYTGEAIEDEEPFGAFPYDDEDEDEEGEGEDDDEEDDDDDDEDAAPPKAKGGKKGGKEGQPECKQQ